MAWDVDRRTFVGMGALAAAGLGMPAYAKNGKKLNAIFREVERAEDYSIAEYQVFSGGSVSSSLFPVRAACVLMKRRDKPFLFIAKPTDDAMSRRMRIEFPKVRTVAFGDGTNGLSLSLEECAMFGTME